MLSLLESGQLQAQTGNEIPSTNPDSTGAEGDIGVPAVLPPPPTGAGTNNSPPPTTNSNPPTPTTTAYPTSASTQSDTGAAGFTTTMDSLLGIPDRFNFFVGDNPAFKLVDFDPSSAIRPSTPHDISVQLSEFWSGNSLVIPASFGIQVSPFKILQSQMKKPSEWAKNWQPLSIGLAAKRSSSVTTTSELVGDFAVGLTYTLLDESTERHFENALRSHIGKQLDSLKPGFETAFIDSVQGTDSSLTTAKIRSTMANQMQAYVNQKYRARTLATYNTQIAPFKTKWKQENWASQKLAFGCAASWNASDPTSLVFDPDSLGPGITTNDTLLEFPGFTQFRQLSAYATYSLPFPRKDPNTNNSSADSPHKSGSFTNNSDSSSTTSSGKSATKKSKRQWGMLMVSGTFGLTQLDDTTQTPTGTFNSFGQEIYNINRTTNGFQQNAGISARFYMGSNRAKVYWEAQAFWDSRVSDQIFYLGDMGLEIGILNGIWVQMYAGVTNLGQERFVSPGLDNHATPTSQFIPKRPQFIANFDFRFTFPESFYSGGTYY